MSTLQLQLLLVFLLLLVNAAFAGSEIALISLRPSQVERLKNRGRAGRALAALAEAPNEYLATIQIGITLAGFLASAAAATSFADVVAPWLEGLGEAARPVSIISVTVVLTFLTLVVGELTPKRIAMARAERWALFAALPLRWLGIASKPAVWLLSTSTGLLVRLAGVDPKESGDEVSDDELRDLLLSRSGFHRQREILEGALEIGDRVLRQILVPRPAVTTVPTDATVAEAMSLLKEAGHSRAPLCDDLDRVSGILHLIDLVDAQGPAAAVVRPALHLPETVGVLEALRAMQHGRHSLAIVVDEHGGGAGIVSLEDVLEEFVGEIYDEFDQDQRTVEVADDGSIAVDGTYPVHDLDDIGVELPSTEAATVAGVILEHLGRLPRRGEQVTIGGWTLVVDHIEEQAIRRVVLVPSGDDDAEQS